MLFRSTHGRGFWILDDITPLREITAEVARADVFLFQPADAINMPPGTDNGTPMPRDEALAENPPYGAMIDYYLRSNVTGPVTLEILDPSGEVIRRYSSDDKPPAINPDALNIPTSWVRAPKPLSNQAGMHRWIWDLRPTAPQRTGPGGGGGGGGSAAAVTANFFGGRAPAVLPGSYTVRLTVNRKSYTRALVVSMDPRSK